MEPCSSCRVQQITLGLQSTGYWNAKSPMAPAVPGDGAATIAELASQARATSKEEGERLRSPFETPNAECCPLSSNCLRRLRR